MRIVMLAAALSALAVTARPADACSLLGNEQFVVEADPSDTTPPSGVTVLASSLVRHATGDMCDFAGVITLRVTATDDRSAVGFLVSAVQGTVPLGEVGAPLAPGLTGELVFYLDDVAPPYELELRAIDRAGNLGPASRVTLTVAAGGDGDDDEIGCASAGGPATWPVAALVPLALLLRRRPRVS